MGIETGIAWTDHTLNGWWQAMNERSQRPGRRRPSLFGVGRLRRFKSGMVTPEAIRAVGAVHRVHVIGPVDITNLPAQRRNAAYRTPGRRSEWTDGCSRVLLLWIGFALIIGLAILLR